jgi:peptide/nickel transport system permease protein
MAAYIVRRLLGSLPVLLGLSIAIFILIQLPPGGPADFYASQASGMTQADRDAIKRQLGLDQPLPIQYLNWLGAVLRGDWGRSFQDSRTVTSIIGERLPASLELTVASLLVSVLASVPLGVLAATKGNAILRNTLEVLSIICISVPNFWLGLVSILVLSVWINLFPTGGMFTTGVPWSLADNLYHLLLPAIVASLYWVASWSRYIRGSMLEVIRQDYVRTAQAKGLRQQTVLWRHALRNGLIPFITVVGLRLPHLLSGVVVIEIVFAWPGIGLLLYQSMLNRDYPVQMGCFMGVAVLVIIGNLLADALYAVVDPRIRY